MWWYVATLARYVLVQADTPEEARRLGEVELGRPAVTVREAEAGEISLMHFQQKQAASWEMKRNPPPW